MAKMFYSLDEAAQRLGMSEQQVLGLVESGQLQEFRDRDRHMFKVEQVDLLAGGGEGDALSLDDAPGISLASDSGSAMNLESPKEQSGISIFEVEETDDSDPAARTQVTETGSTDFALDPGGSGTGLMDLTREVEDSSFGAEGLDEAYAAPATAEPAAGQPLFESSGADTEGAAPAMAGAMVMAEPYDGAGSGLTGGAALGMIGVAALTLIVTIGGMTGGFTSLLEAVGGNFWAFVGGCAGAVLIFAVIGWVLGRKS